MKVIGRLLDAFTRLPLYWRVLGLRGIYSFYKFRHGRAEGLREISIRGQAAPVFLRASGTDLSVLWEIFFDREYDLDLGFQFRPRVIIDAGANIGLASVFYANRYPAARIIALEPDRQNFEVLLRNVEAYPNVVPLRAALWKRGEPIELVDPGRGEHGFVTGDQGAEMGRVVDVVDAWTVDGLMHRYGIESIDLFKVDIEGAEKEVFENAATWIDKVEVVIVELHERFKPGCVDAVLHATRTMKTVAEYGKMIVRSR